MKRGHLLRRFVVLFIAMMAVAGVAQNDFDLSNATIPRDELVPGGLPRDGIPAIDHPQFVKPSEVDFLRDEDRVLSVKIGNEVRAYPLRIVNWHEIVNDHAREFGAHGPFMGVLEFIERTSLPLWSIDVP
jgi:hypothetical protein